MSENKSEVSPRPNNLIYHPGRVAAWLKDKPIYPLEVVLVADGETWLDIRIVKQTLAYLSEKGLKSVTVQSAEPVAAEKTAEIKNVAQELKLAFRVTEKPHYATQTETSKPYDKCYALPFRVYIAVTGEVYPCAAFIGNKEFCWGNLYEKSFADIWQGKKREKVAAKFTGEFFCANCPATCDGDEMNKYLYELKHSGRKNNFVVTMY